VPGQAVGIPRDAADRMSFRQEPRNQPSADVSRRPGDEDAQRSLDVHDRVGPECLKLPWRKICRPRAITPKRSEISSIPRIDVRRDFIA
jgi:hypothetical protein